MFNCSISLVLFLHIFKSKRSGQDDSCVCILTAYRYSLSSISETATNANKSKSNVDGLTSGTPNDHAEETVSSENTAALRIIFFWPENIFPGPLQNILNASHIYWP